MTLPKPSDKTRPTPAAPGTVQGRVSLVMATYQRTHCLAETVRQLVDQQTRPPHELIIVNNDAAAGAEAAIRAVVPADPRIRIVSCTTGRQGACRNHGLSLATGDYVAFVDDDDDYDPRYIEALAGVLDLGLRSVRCRMQTCGCASPDCTGKPTIDHHPLTPNTMARRDFLSATWGEPPNEDRAYWENHPIEGAIDECLVITCRGPGKHSPRSTQTGGSWRIRILVTLVLRPDEITDAEAVIGSLKEQRYSRFHCLVLVASNDSAPWGDAHESRLGRFISDDPRFTRLTADAARLDLPTRLLGAGQWTLSADDVLLPLRAHTRLAHRNVLGRLAHVFGQEPDTWMTYGSCLTEPFMPAWPVASFSPQVWRTRDFRRLTEILGLADPVAMRAALGVHLAATLGDLDLRPPAITSDDIESMDLALFLGALETAGADHAFPMLGTQAIRRMRGGSPSATEFEQRGRERQLAHRTRQSLPLISSLPTLTPRPPLPPTESRNSSPRVAHTAFEPSVLWSGPVYDPSGYASELREMVLGLSSLGTHPTLRAVANRSQSFRSNLTDETMDRLDALLAQRVKGSGIAVLHLPPSFLDRIPGMQYMIGRTMFETTGLNPEFVDRCNRMDELWLPSDFNIETFRAAGVRTRLHKVPGGIDSGRFRPGLDPILIPGTRGTVFLSINEWKTRKGWQTLLRAWARAFSADADVTLVFRASIPGSTETDSGPAINREIDLYLASLGHDRASVAPIIVLGRQLPYAHIPRLYASADVYVTPSSGEGWGYPYMEAMASGLLTIATKWSGNLEFMHEDNSLLCEVERLIPADDSYVGPMPGQEWALPSAEHLSSLLRIALDDPERAKKLADRGLEEMRSRWTWRHAATNVQKRLETIAKTHRLGRMSARHPVPIVSVEASTPLVRWEGPQLTTSSLGLVNREFCSELLRLGDTGLVIRSTLAHDFSVESGSRHARLAARIQQSTSRPADVHVAHQWPPRLDPPKEGAWVLMQPWEYGGLPGEWIPVIRDLVDEYWVYCEWQRQCAIKSGIPESKIRVIPLGIDPSTFTPEGARYPLKTKKRRKFLAVGGIIPRKGMDILVETYLRTFSAEDDVCLVIKGLSTRWAYHGNSGHDDFAKLPALSRDGKLAEIEFVGDTLTEEQIASLYRACDVFVAPFRGEGFGLPIVEAMASGLPVIVTDAGPVFDICDDRSAFLVPAEQHTVDEAVAGLPAGALGYWWAEPNREALALLMRQVLDQPEDARVRAQQGRARVLAQFTIASGAAVIRDRLKDLATRVPIRLVPLPVTAPFPLEAPKATVILHHPSWHRPDWADPIKAYLRKFCSTDDVSLIIALDPAQGVSPDQALERIANLRKELGIEEDAAADMILVPDVLDESVIASLLAAAQVVLISQASIRPLQRDSHPDIVICDTSNIQGLMLPSAIPSTAVR
jgi:glycosyltransferase involved in cell wall biosynthesis